MEVIADLHIHSHFSIATARDADLEHLDLWGRYKGCRWWAPAIAPTPGGWRR